MRTLTRFLVGIGLGGGALAAYLWVVVVDSVLTRATATAPWAVALEIDDVRRPDE